MRRVGWMVVFLALVSWGCHNNGVDSPGEVICEPACAANEVCREGVCEPKPLACEPACGANEVCREGVCEPKSVVCEPACAANEVCREGVCEPKSVICEPACGANEVCREGVCEPKSVVCEPACGANEECREGTCVALPASCTNRIQDEDESDVDCGGSSDCPRCIDGKKCTLGSDCVGGICHEKGWCESLPCANGKQDVGESDVDCGGLFCDACVIGKRCNVDRDCQSGVCDEGICQAQSCTDGRRNQDETDIDCGGSCPKCGLTETCLVESDCAEGLLCIANICVLPEPETTADVRVVNAYDVAYSYTFGFGGSMINGGETFHLGRSLQGSSYVGITAALRFTNVQIPRGATITSAYVYWYPHNEVDSSIRLHQNIYAEKAANSMPFNFSNYDSGRPDQRTRTSASVMEWIVRCNASCTEATEYDCPQRKADCWNRSIEYKVPKDLKALVQEVINLPDWAPGNAMSIIFTNVTRSDDVAQYNGNRTVTGYDVSEARGAHLAPRLAVEFEPLAAAK